LSARHFNATGIRDGGRFSDTSGFFREKVEAEARRPGGLCAHAGMPGIVHGI